MVALALRYSPPKVVTSKRGNPCASLHSRAPSRRRTFGCGRALGPGGLDEPGVPDLDLDLEVTPVLRRREGGQGGVESHREDHAP